MNILFKRVKVQQGKNLSSGIVCPEGSDNFFFHWASISVTQIKNNELITIVN